MRKEGIVEFFSKFENFESNTSNLLELEAQMLVLTESNEKLWKKKLHF